MNRYDLWFSLSKLKDDIKISLLKKYKSTYEIWKYYYRLSPDNAADCKIKLILKKAWNKELIDNLQDQIQSQDMKISIYGDDIYPKKLLDYDDSPFMIFYKGDMTKLNFKKSAAIVGSRKCSSYGINVATLISKELSLNNINIISGMAYGIDGISHTSCLKNNGYTCAVLGSGVDVIYPKTNSNLYKDIIKNGCVISEFLPGTKPLAYNFPKRNRIISALSDIVIIVEAGEKSGSLITASCALEQGKDVIAVPGNIFSKQSVGTNKLIKDGAYPFTSMEDIWEILNIHHIKIEEHSLKFKNNTEKKLYSLINYNPIHIDDLVRITHIDIKHLYELLFEMQFKNEILCLSGNYYVRVDNTI